MLFCHFAFVYHDDNSQMVSGQSEVLFKNRFSGILGRLEVSLYLIHRQLSCKVFFYVMILCQ